ncbi:MAG: proliferating cell nuclear antigen (pcna) [Candidatus Woesearchaeota archaeon]
MKLSLSEPRLLKDSVSIISDLVTEARFKVNKDAVELVAMDPANVAMVIYKLLGSSFVEYDVKEETSFAINLNDMKAVLRRAKPNDSLTLDVGDKMTLTLKGTSTRRFELPLIEVEEKEQRIPDLKFDAEIQCESSVLSEAIDDMDIIGESVVFGIDKDVLKISSSSELSKAEVEIKNAGTTKIKAKDMVKSKYSIEYLKKMIQGAKLSDNAVLKFSGDYPLRLEFTSVDKLQLAFILAPRVDND